MAASLYSIEKDLNEIIHTQKEILSFLELENEAQVKADTKTLMDSLMNYKYTWDNELSIASQHNQVIEIKNRSDKNRDLYFSLIQKEMESKSRIVTQTKVNAVYMKFEKLFRWYRLSLCNFTLSTLLDVMLSKNFAEEYMQNQVNRIKELSNEYRHLFGLCSCFLENLGNNELQANFMSKLGNTSETVGNWMNAIPFVKGDALMNTSKSLNENSKTMKMKYVQSFSQLSNPETMVILNELDKMNLIYNHTNEIYMDNQNVCLRMCA